MDEICSPKQISKRAELRCHQDSAVNLFGSIKSGCFFLVSVSEWKAPANRHPLPSPPFSPSHHTAYFYPLNENRPANSLRSCACAESSSLAAALSSAVAELVWMMSEIWLIPLVTW